MCLGAIDFAKARKLKSILDHCIDDLVNNHRDKLCKDPAKDFIREREFTPQKIFSTMLQYGSKNAESELIDIIGLGGSKRNINAAFLGQRRKLGEDAIPFLFRTFTESLLNDDELALRQNLVRGYDVLSVDGTDVNVAYQPGDPLTYVSLPGKRGYNQIHLNAIHSHCSGLWLAASVQGVHKKQERSALIEMLSQLTDPSKIIITADRGYEGFIVFYACLVKHAGFVIRIKDIDSNGFLSKLDLGDGEFDKYVHIRLEKGREAKFLQDPAIAALQGSRNVEIHDAGEYYDIWLRIVRFRLPNGEYIVVATNLDKSFGSKEIAEIYRLRWGVEVAFRKLKYSVGLVNFHSWKMQYILQELYIRLILHNYSQAMIDIVAQRASVDAKEAAEEAKDAHDAVPKKPKSMVKIAFSKAVTICRNLLKDFTETAAASALSAIRAHTYDAKPNRSYARKVKPQSNKQFGYRAS